MNLAGSIRDDDQTLRSAQPSDFVLQISGVCKLSAHATPSLQPATRPWWLWWNILSLDAPTVAVVWAILFAGAAHVPVQFSDVLLLSLSVWVIYTADRLLDGSAPRNGAPLQERHLSCARHRRAFIFVLALAVIAILWLLASRVAPSEAWAGMKLGVVVAFYMLGIHAGEGFLTRLIPKEIAVGALFAAGSTLPVWSRHGKFSADFWVCLFLYMALCSLNCLSIETWEADSPHHLPKTTRHSFVAWGRSRLGEITVTLAALTLVAIFIFLPQATFAAENIAIFLAAIFLFLLNRGRHLFSSPALRVLADATLVLAGLFALAIRM